MSKSSIIESITKDPTERGSPPEATANDLVTIHNGDWLFGEEDLGINNSVDDDSDDN
jgi:hypothetical protein